MRTSRLFVFLLGPLSLAACEPAKTPEAPAGASTSAGSREPSEAEATRAALELLRDPRCKWQRRNVNALLSELQHLEKQRSSGRLSAAEEVKLDVKLADGFAELSCVAQSERRDLLARPSTDAAGRQLELASKIIDAADKQALKLNIKLLQSGAPCFMQAESLPGATCADALLYYIGLGFERADDHLQAMKAYLRIIEDHKRSPFLPYAQFGAGEMFRRWAREGDTKSREAVAVQNYESVLGAPSKKNDVYDYALLRLGMYGHALGEEDTARKMLSALAWRASRDAQGSAAIALRVVPQNLVPADPAGLVEELQKSCESGRTQSCVDGAEILRLIGDKTLDEQMFAMHSNACDKGHAKSCGMAAIMTTFGVGAVKDASQAAALHEKACYGGMAQSCSTLAVMVRDGDGVPRDESRWANLVIKACESGGRFACADAGISLAMGAGVPKDEARAAALLSKGCEAGDLGTCVMLGRLVEAGRGVPKDESQARDLYSQGCTDKMTYGCTDLGRILEEGASIKRDEASAAKHYATGCDGHRSESCLRLGALFEQGRGVGKDEARAATLYKKACDQLNTNGEACYRYGVFHEQGRIVSKDEARAAVYFTKACEEGHARGCHRIGRLFAKGADPDKDAAVAAASYTKSCESGDGKGCHDLGLLVASGFGAKKDDTRANNLFKKSCEAGHGRGCYRLAMRLEHSEGWLGLDMTRAVPLARKACDVGELFGCYALGGALEFGLGAAMDKKRADDLFKKACDGSVIKACKSLGILNKHDPGYKGDPKRAKDAFERACLLGDEESCRDAKK